MIKSKKASVIFLCLALIVLPYSIFLYQSDFIASIIPGWHTNINSFSIIAAFLKSIVLVIASFGYWKIYKASETINRKIFITHFALTLPSVLISKFPLNNFINFNDTNHDEIINQIAIVGKINILMNIVFIIAQIIFWTNFFRLKTRAIS